MFEAIVGNERVKSYLTKMIEKQAIGQSLLFAGPESARKDLFARELAVYLLKSDVVHVHPDFCEFRPEGKAGLHSIDAMRRFSEEVYLEPMSAPYKVMLLYDAERMLPYSSNALLKTFEEPAARTVIILMTERPDALLPTIRSRCRIVRFESNPQLEENEAPLQSLLFKHLSKPRFSTWQELVDAVKEISDLIHTQQEEFASHVQNQLVPKEMELTATQKQAIEKEVEGTLSMQLMQEGQTLLASLLGWYRDLEVLHHKVDSSFLFFPKWAVAMQHSLEHNDPMSLMDVERFTVEAEKAINRSTSLQTVLETLFIQLKRL